jgi:gas vesicle protein
MNTSEVIAIIRDISIIMLIGLWLIGMVAAGVIGIRIYRSVKQIAGRVKETYQAIRNGLVRPLLRIKGRVSSLGRMSSRVPSRVRHQLQAREGGMRMTKGSLIVVMTGVSAGVLAGLLLAPKPGRETRQMLKSQVGALRDQASQYATSLRDGQQDGAREQHGPEATLEVKVRPNEGVEVENSAGSGEVEVLVRSDRTRNQRQRLSPNTLIAPF